MNTPTPTTITWEELVEHALDASASDLHVHITPEFHTTVRARLDGVLVPWGELPPDHARTTLTRLQGDAGLATGTTLYVGEGRIRHTSPRHGNLDLRLTITPLVNGAIKLALRLPAIAAGIPLEKLGFAPEIFPRVQDLLAAPDGLLLSTGPVGAGKTTTMLAALQTVGAPGRAVVTVEDPVERVIPNADQIEVNEQSGFTYEHILRSLLRMDLDALLIGEIRDQSTARHAVQIAKAGRIVLSTLHASSAVNALLRLQELSGLGTLEAVEPVRGVISQRLLRKKHEPCNGTGCQDCLGTGWHGRIPIHEVLTVNDTIIDAVLNRSSLRVLEHVAHTAGMRTFKEDAQRWIDDGVTTHEELERVVGRDQ